MQPLLPSNRKLSILANQRQPENALPPHRTHPPAGTTQPHLPQRPRIHHRNPAPSRRHARSQTPPPRPADRPRPKYRPASRPASATPALRPPRCLRSMVHHRAARHIPTDATKQPEFHAHPSRHTRRQQPDADYLADKPNAKIPRPHQHPPLAHRQPERPHPPSPAGTRRANRCPAPLSLDTQPHQPPNRPMRLARYVHRQSDAAHRAPIPIQLAKHPAHRPTLRPNHPRPCMAARPTRHPHSIAQHHRRRPQPLPQRTRRPMGHPAARQHPVLRHHPPLDSMAYLLATLPPLPPHAQSRPALLPKHHPKMATANHRRRQRLPTRPPHHRPQQNPAQPHRRALGDFARSPRCPRQLVQPYSRARLDKQRQHR